MDEKLINVYNFLKENEFTKTMELFKQELDFKPNMPYKSWALEPIKPKQLNFHTLSHSQGKIGYLTPDGLRQQSTHSNLMKNIFGKSPDVETSKPNNNIQTADKKTAHGSSNYLEHFELTYNSFGNSEDHGIIESKKLVHCSIEDSSSEGEPHNFSFCESDTKAKSINKESLYSDKKQEDTTLTNVNIASSRKNIFCGLATKRLPGMDVVDKILPPVVEPSFSDGG